MNLPNFISNPIIGELATYSEVMQMPLDEIADLNELLAFRTYLERKGREEAERAAESKRQG